jgi:hypothetical protein
MLWKFCATPKKNQANSILRKFNPEILKYSSLDFHKKVLDGVKKMTHGLRLKLEHVNRIELERMRQSRERKDKLMKNQLNIEKQRTQQKILEDLSLLFLYRDFF